MARQRWEQILAVLVMAVREASGKSASPTVVIANSQSVKTTEAGGPRGDGVGLPSPKRLRAGRQEVKGRKRHIAVNTLGLAVRCDVTTADVQDCNASGVVERCQQARTLGKTGLRRPPFAC